MSPREIQPWHRFWPRGLPHAIQVPEATLSHHLDVAALRYPRKAAIVFFERVLRYGELKAQADALAAHLQQAAGLAAGDRVLLLSQNCPQFVVAFQAIVRCGGVVVPMNAMSTATEFDHALADSGARIAIAAQEMLPALRPSLAQGRLRHGVVITYADALPATGEADPLVPVPEALRAPRARLDHPALVAWADALDSGHAGHGFAAVATSPDDLCALPYTSGTTGKPKGCMHTHRTLLASTWGAVLWRGLHAEAVVLCVAPLFHLLGMQNAMLMPISQGATVIMLPRWDAASAARLIERHRVTTWAAPPAMLNDFFAHPEAGERDLSSLTVLNGGGAAMPEAVAAMLKARFGIVYIEGYGLTETASFLHCNPLGRGKRQCLGIPTFGVHTRIVDPETLADLPQGELGELATAAAQNLLGYWRDDAANAAAFFERDGRRYFRTGDLAVMDEDGYFFLRDRLKRMINVSGYKVWPAEVESLLHDHPAIHEACVIAMPDPRQGESVAALVVLKPGRALDAAGLIGWCREHMATYKAPRHIEFRSALPKSGTGKILWRELQAAARADATEGGVVRQVADDGGSGAD